MEYLDMLFADLGSVSIPAVSILVPLLTFISASFQQSFPQDIGGTILGDRVVGVVSVSGLTRTRDTISVAPGWNLIGSISTPLPVSSIVSLPNGIVMSSYFGYNAGYAASDTLKPGSAYWVKIGSAGKIVLK
jgi:hypothetical protein